MIEIIIGIIIILIILRQFVTPEIYDFLIIKMTRLWYKTVLEKCNDNDKILDVGIGTGTALLKNKDIVFKKKLRYYGLDIDEQYVKKCKKIFENDLNINEKHIEPISVYEENDIKKAFINNDNDELFDVVYFSGSITLLPDPLKALKIAKKLLKPNNNSMIYITQTYQIKNSPILSKIKPLLKYITTIDFGQLTYKTDIVSILNKFEEGKIVEMKPIENSINTSYQVAYIIAIKV